MKRYSFLLLCLLLLLFVPFVQAKISVGENPQNSPINNKGIAEPDYIRTPPFPPKQETLPNLLGQEHNYSVILRGNGEAIVTGKMTFSNNSDQEMTTLDLESPIGKLADNFVAYQQQRQGSCISYWMKEKTYTESAACSEFKTLYECDTAAVNHAVYNCSWYACVNKCLTTGTPIESVCPDSECSQYEEPDYFIDSYNTKNIYQKLKSNYRGNIITIKLNKKVKPQ